MNGNRSTPIAIPPFNSETLSFCGELGQVSLKKSSKSLPEELFEQTFNALIAEIVILNEAGTIVGANKSWKSFAQSNGLNLTDSGLGLNYLGVCDDARGKDAEYAKLAGEGIRSVMSGKHDSFRLDYPCHSPDEMRWFSMHVTRFPVRDTFCVVIAHQNITEQRIAEDSLKAAHAETEMLLSSISSVLIGVDENDRVCRWNSTAERTFGLSASEVLGKSFPECPLTWNWAALFEILPACFSEIGSSGPLKEISFTYPDGRAGYLGLTANLLRKENGNEGGFLLLGTDITDLKTLQASLNQAQKLESIGQLAAGIAHEINTPTQFVGDNIRFCKEAFSELIGLIDALREIFADEQSSKEDVTGRIDAAIVKADLNYIRAEIPQAIEQSLYGISRISKLVLAMKEFSHPGGEEMIPVDLNHAIENTITVGRNEWKYVSEMKTDFDASIPPVKCLPAELNQVILNLIVNAAHAIGDANSHLNRDKGITQVKTRRDGAWVEICISDNGTGMPKEIRNRIFDPFFTTKPVGKGTGQGLAIARSAVVDKHGGSIDFQSEVGIGTTFIIRLPIDGKQTGSSHDARPGSKTSLC